MDYIWVVLLFFSLQFSGGGGLVPVEETQRTEFNVMDFGAVVDGSTDSSNAFAAAWSAACARHGELSIMAIPQGTFFVNPLIFSGPCNGSVQIRLQGTVLAPADLAPFTGDKIDWIAFRHIDHLLLTGGGTFDGRGAAAWTCVLAKNCTTKRPTMVSFKFISNSTVQNIRLVNAKMFHAHIFSCVNLTLQQLEISSPEDSPNTDGIHVANSNNVKVADSVIASGDDCVSLGGGNTDIIVSRIRCGPGHGISLGSLGGYAGDKNMSRVLVTNCNLTGTMNGVRIKTWAKPHSLSVSDIVFQGINMDRVSNPIIIDQHYCPNQDCVHQTPSMVKISNVRFQDIKGSSSTKVAIKLSCSEALPCEDLQLIDINLAFVGKDNDEAVALCTNAQGRSLGSVVPSSCL
ncbi:exopolygalacturonase-like [Wolffia australiana]